ncbi:Helix-turn-helix domain protein [compost metagenome]
MLVLPPLHFASERIMDDKLPSADMGLAQLAGAIAEPARARMLCSLLDGHARTATELSTLAEVGASTASAHLSRLRDDGLLSMVAQGKHRYYRLASTEVARALEALLVVAGVPAMPFTPSTPDCLRHARTCYDHMAGTIAVALHDQLHAQGWLLDDGGEYRLSEAGAAGMAAWASTCRNCSASAAASPVPAWTGANGAPTWAARWEPPCCSWPCASAGPSANSTAAPCASRRLASGACWPPLVEAERRRHFVSRKQRKR